MAWRDDVDDRVCHQIIRLFELTLKLHTGQTQGQAQGRALYNSLSDRYAHATALAFAAPHHHQPVQNTHLYRKTESVRERVCDTEIEKEEAG